MTPDEAGQFTRRRRARNWAMLLALLGLMQSRRDWTGPELAERLGVTDRTVRVIASMNVLAPGVAVKRTVVLEPKISAPRVRSSSTS